jgi:hypothetical protein
MLASRMRTRSQDEPARATWRLEDYLDFEVAFASWEKADGEIRSDAIHPARRHASRRELFREWLDQQRQILFPEESPGKVLQSSLHILAIALFVIGAAAGKVAILHALYRSHGSGLPVNVLPLWIATAGLPAFFAVVQAAAILLRRVPFLHNLPRWNGAAVSLLVRRPLRKAFETVCVRMPVERRLDAAAFAGFLRKRTRDFPVSPSRLFSHTAQWFGLGYTLGAFILFLGSVTFSHQVFAWQTTGSFLEERHVSAFVRATSTPWRGMLPDSIPNERHISESRFFRFHFPPAISEAASSRWASYLLLSILTFGVIPRLLLFALSAIGIHRALAREEFGGLRYDGLERSLRQPESSWNHESAGAGGSSVPQSAAPLLDGMPAGRPCILIVPAEITSATQTLKRWLEREHELLAVLETSQDAPADPTLLAHLKENAGSPEPSPCVVVAREAFMPPTRETLDQIQALRITLGTATPILVALVGKPAGRNPDKAFDPPDSLSVSVWRKRLETLADPNLGVESARL